jgi:hypothetical protein
MITVMARAEVDQLRDRRVSPVSPLERAGAPRGLLFRAGSGWCAPRGRAHRATSGQDWLIEKSVNSKVAGALFVEQTSTP